MKKTTSFILSIALALTASSQTLNIQTGDVTYAIPSAQAGEMLYTGGTQLTVMGKSLAVTDITKMHIDASEVSDNTVTITYAGDAASVVIAGNIAKYVDATVSGAHVSIIQSAEVGDATCGEITYSLSGSSDNGEFYMEGSFKSTLELRGLTLTNPSGSPLNIQNGKRIEMSVKNGTVNTLTDCSGGSQKGCLVCKGHLELKGKGTLNVYGNTSHAIYAKEYIEMKNCTVNVLSAVKDGLNCNQYFLMESGTLNISGTGDDGIQVSYKDDTDREAEDTGSITIAGGAITVDVTATAAKAIKADGDVFITGGEITASTSGNGKWDADDVKTKGATCISADGNIQIDNGTLILSSTGSGGKAISCDADLIITGGDINAFTSGGIFAYVNGVGYDNYTGNTDNLDSDYKSSPKGMKADGNVTINGGNISVTTTGIGSEGIESKAIMTINDGNIVINSYDDGLNSGSHMYLNGGDITVVATNNDGIDSNGNMYITGGYIRAFGASAPECGLDANEEGGFSVIFTGGVVLAVGGSNSVPSLAESTQAYVTGSGTVTAGSTITLSNGSEALATFTVPENYTAGGSAPGPGTGGPGTMAGGPGGGGPGGPGTGGPGGPGGSGGGILITCPGLASGSSYTLTNGSASSNVTAALQGNSGGMRP